MKKNTETILLALYPASNDQWFLPLHAIYALVPQLSGGGKRSLLHLLKKEEYISTVQVGTQTRVYLDSRGRELLISRFPALSERWGQWNGGWACCVFVEAPRFDRQFRYLRQLLLKEGCFALSRGVYIAPFPFSSILMGELSDRYSAATAVFTVEQWQFQREQSFVLAHLGIADVLTAYSGVSSEITDLLGVIGNSTTASDQQKKLIRTVFDRFCESLGHDPGFASYYGGGQQMPAQLLSALQPLLQFL
ncbi:hypothetical protein KBC79_04195 [Candidatus Woesebacteria bacterium]|nr:hypothetical protein [Candidatus Woesebacteria bacterium]